MVVLRLKCCLFKRSAVIAEASSCKYGIAYLLEVSGVCTKSTRRYGWKLFGSVSATPTCKAVASSGAHSKAHAQIASGLNDRREVV